MKPKNYTTLFFSLKIFIMLYYFRLFTLAIIFIGFVSCKKYTKTLSTTTSIRSTLGGSPGACTPAVFAGTYTKGVALTSANTVTVQVDAGTLDGYYIQTNTVNGVYFNKVGTFTSLGVQNVVLVGQGTPANSGAQNFIVTLSIIAYSVGVSASTCTFPLTFN